jgi:hypothetical protein
MSPRPSTVESSGGFAPLEPLGVCLNFGYRQGLLHTNMFEYKKPTILDIGPAELHSPGDTIGQRLLWRLWNKPLHGVCTAHRLRRGQCHRKADSTACHAGQSTPSVGQDIAPGLRSDCAGK